MIGAKYCEESLISDDEEDDDSIEGCHPFSKSCGNFRTISYDPIVKKKISVPRIKHSSKKSVRRSAALISANDVNDRSESRQKFLCCDRCANSGSRDQDRRRRRRQSRINVRNCERNRRVSVRTSSSSFLGYRPGRDFPLPRKKLSSEKCEDNVKSVNYSTCNCESSNRFLKPKFIRSNRGKHENLAYNEPRRKSNHRFLKRENLHRRISDNRFLNIVSSSDDQDVDYQVPIEYSKSCESCNATLVPKSSHITVRICSANSVSSLSSDCSYDHRSLDFKSSLQDLEERVGRGLRAMCCCCSSEEAEDRFSGFRKAGISDTESCDLKSLPKTQYYRNRGPEFGERNTCCCNKCRKTLFDSSKKPDDSIKYRSKVYNQTYKDVSTSECEEASFREKFRKRRVMNTRSNKKFNRWTNFPSSSSKFEENLNSGLENENRRLCVTKNWCQRRDYRNKTSDSPIVLSAPEYRNFLERCQRIRESIRCMMRDKFPCKNARKECKMTADKIGSKCSSNILENLRPMEHWSQYGDRMRDVANEYKRLRLCLDQMEPEKRNSGYFGIKREEPFLPDKSEEKCDRCKLPPSENSRSVWFEKIEKEKESCCKKEVERIEEMRAREADLVKTLERFCEKIKRVKSEFDKPFLPRLSCCKKTGSIVNQSRCNEQSCRKKMKERKRHGKFKAKKLLIFPPEGEDGPPLTLFKNSSSVNCRVKGDPEKGFKYNVTYVQRFVSSTWYPSKNEAKEYSVDSG